MASHPPVTENTLIAIKIAVHDTTKKLKLPLKDLGADKLIPKLRHLLLIRAGQDVVFERYSDSIGGYVVLDPASPAVFKTLVRAAKAKLKLRLRATITPPPAPLDKSEIKHKVGQMPDPLALMHAAVAHGPALAPLRGSTAFDQRSVGPGIFQFRDPPPAQKPVEVAPTDEAATVACPAFTSSSKDFFTELANHGVEQELALRTSENPARASTWTVYCNECDCAMDNVHFHCSVCDGGDYDLCQACVDSGKLCPGEGHWLIKRAIDNGKIVGSTTERLAPKQRAETTAAVQTSPVEVEKIENVSVEREMPGAFTDDTRTLNDEPEGASRTCNNCIIGLPDHEFVTCTKCDDFDLCRRCHVADKHGHHPAHQFEPAGANAQLSMNEQALLAPGRNVRHNAICDGCDENIYGIRHKCFTCPDFDYCNDCVKDARRTHPRHRFAQLYEPIALSRGVVSVTHHGIYCDGPLCKDKPFQSYIQGVRYKCVVCHDLDFCASCEAVPSNTHNKTHPLVKFKTPVNNVTISTQNEDKSGRVRNMGDKFNIDVAPPKQNVTTPVKTVADIEPSQKASEDDIKVRGKQTTPPLPTVLPIRNLHETAKAAQDAPLEAHFVRDTIVDGTSIESSTCFTQVWTLSNPGPRAWPVGCSVRFVGGDNMLNYEKMSLTGDLSEATESNVIGREVQPGEEVAFKVVLKAPAREGKSISYWRIKAPDGTPFGHKLWCDIEVKKAEPVAPIESAKKVSAPTALLDLEEQEQMMDQANMAKYWTGYQQRMATIRFASAQRQAALAHQAQAQAASAATYQAQCDWRKQMEEFVRRTTNASNMLQPSSSDDGTKADMTVKSDATSNTAPTTIVNEEAKEGGDLRESQMIFPTLDRESPSSSAYESLGSSVPASTKTVIAENDMADVKPADAPVASATSPEVPATLAQENDEEAFEDISELEVFSADGAEESSDDGFMTDEEYDILDASDQETVASR